MEENADTRIKICGLRREADVLLMNELLPEYVGFVFAQKSRRYVTPGQAGAMRGKLDGRITPVGVFVDAEPQLAAGLLNQGIIEIAQLHGKEDEDYLKQLRQLTNKPFIKAFRIETREDAARAAESSAWRILVDHGAGGTGEAFDWGLLNGLERPYFLAGGLSAENVGEAIRRLHPFAVDVSSGVEKDGWKDPDKVRAFIQTVRRRTDRD